MIQELLGQTNFVGRDGFYWWIGQVETEKGSQEKGDDRYKVRIVGQHLKDCNAVPYGDLPLAIVMMPSTAPRREGAGDYQSVKYKSGDWVVGFFLDGKDGQQPVIMGSIGQQVNATQQINKEKPSGSCLAFTTFVEQNINPSSGVSSTEQSKLKSGGLSGNAAASGTNTAQQVNLNNPVNNKNENASAQLLATKCCNSEVNPSGEGFCVEVSDAKCDSPENDQSKFETILSDLFANIQSSGGQIGTQIISNYTGKLYDYVGIAQSYINKATRLASSLVARIKGEIFALIKQGAKKVIDFLLTQEVVDVEATNAAMNAAVAAGTDPNAVKPVKKRVGRLRGITKWINEQLKKINCVMDDLDERLMEFLTDLIFEALEQVFNAARCFVDRLVNDIFNAISDFLTEAINAILGPLQALLTLISSPLDILGSALKAIFDLLGISCGGSGKKCASNEQTKNCSGSCGDAIEDGDFLDNLIEDIENGNLDNASGNCDYSSAPAVRTTIISVVGGITNPIFYTGSTNVILPPDDEDITTSPSTFFPSTSSTTGTGDIGDTDDTSGTTAYQTPITPFIIKPITTAPTNTFSSTILDELNGVNVDYISEVVFNSTTSRANNISYSTLIGGDVFDNVSQDTYNYVSLVSNSLFEFESVDSSTENVSYELTADKSIVFEGDTIIITLVANGGVVKDGTTFTYFMFGDIDQTDIQTNKLTGTMVMYNNVAKVSVTIAEDAIEEPIETVNFSIAEISQGVIFSIASSGTPDPTTPSSSVQPAFREPILGSPEVCDDGRIMEVPIIARGDAYLVPPIISITGAGYGASAVPELDENGYLTRIRIQRPGIGYKPSRVRTNCTINNFVVLNPGFGYFREPIVYVDGRSGIARAVIDIGGRVKGVEVIDKTRIFGCTPKVEIFGGNGMGAKAVPVIECRDESLYAEFQKGIAPSGSDSVIDCP
jgi:hypothetical protein